MIGKRAPSIPVFLALVHLATAIHGLNGPLAVKRDWLAHRFRHEAVGVEERAMAKTETITYDATGPDNVASFPVPTSPTVYTVITPSPGASPIPITQISQQVTSYVPIYTLCPLSGSSTTGPRYTNSSRGTASLTLAINPTSINDDCSTSYSSTLTTVCHTTLPGIATAATITNCSQKLTFSTDKSFTLDTTSSTVSLRELTTYFVADWQALATPGAVPSRVDVRVCTNNTGTDVANDDLCINHVEVWSLATITVQVGTIQHVTVEKTISGPSAFYIETLRTDITAVQTLVSVDTTIGVYKPYETVTLLRNVTEPSSSQEPTITKTTTITNTRTVEAATTAASSTSE